MQYTLRVLYIGFMINGTTFQCTEVLLLQHLILEP